MQRATKPTGTRDSRYGFTHRRGSTAAGRVNGAHADPTANVRHPHPFRCQVSWAYIRPQEAFGHVSAKVGNMTGSGHQSKIAGLPQPARRSHSIGIATFIELLVRCRLAARADCRCVRAQEAAAAGQRQSYRRGIHWPTFDRVSRIVSHLGRCEPSVGTLNGRRDPFTRPIPRTILWPLSGPSCRGLR